MKIRNIVAPAAVGIAAAGGLSWWLGRRGGEVEPLLEGESQVWKWRDFDISFTSAGDGPPLVLVHAIYPGASNAQWENNFNVLAKQFRVFAPDLLGFGRSSRPSLAFNPAIYQDMIADFLTEVVEEPAIVVAAGQSAPAVIAAAAADPDRITRLILHSPTGLTRFSAPAPLGQQLMYRWWSLPVVGTLTYFWLVSKRQIARQLRTQTVKDSSLITPSVIENIYRQSHQTGAKWAPIAMLGGRLNTDTRAAYAKVTQPILLLWGELPSYIPVSDSKEFLNLNSNAVLQTFPDGRLMPELEYSAKFNAYIQLWAQGKLAA